MMWVWMLLWVLAVLDGALTCAVLRRSQMIYFVLAVSVLGQAVQNGALLELTGEAAKIEFGGALSLIHNSTEDKLVCSGKIQASDVVIEGTSTTVAEMMADHAAMKADIAALKQFVGMMPPSLPPSPPPSLPPCTMESRGPGGCGGAPYMTQSFPGSLDDGVSYCLANPSCIKVQRDDTYNLIFASDSSSMVQSTEPNGNSGWSCRFKVCSTS